MDGLKEYTKELAEKAKVPQIDTGLPLFMNTNFVL
jgi:hypothetical protein